MSTIRSFEDLDIWIKARLLCKQVFLITNEGNFYKDYDLKSQIKRASGSIMDNIAEGFERDGSREFIQFLSISKGSTGEVKSQLYRALDNKYIEKEKFDELYNMCNEIGKMTKRFIDYLKNTEYKGQKYKTENNPDPKLETRNLKLET